MKNDVITLAHGGGGTKTHTIINSIIIKNLGNPLLNALDDSASITLSSKDIAFTTDSYVVNPLFFPGGNIGNLAVCGTMNDLSMQGAIPTFLSLSLGLIVTPITWILWEFYRIPAVPFDVPLWYSILTSILGFIILCWTMHLVNLLAKVHGNMTRALLLKRSK